MRKIILSMILILIGVLILVYPQSKNTIVQNETKTKKLNSLSIMVEKEAGSGKYNEANEFPQDGYVLNQNLSKCLNGSKIKYENGSLTIKGTKTDYCYAYFDYDALGSLCRNQNMAKCFTQNYKKDSSIIYHDGKADYEGMENYNLEAEDLSYRYTGANNIINNYVCFNSNDETCLEDNLYRIIGFFQNEEGNYETKLIKATEASTKHLGTIGAYCGAWENNDIRFCWNNSNGEASSNIWAESNLNNINLNGYFLNNYLNSIWQGYINNHKWLFGNKGVNLLRINARELYNVDNNKELSTFNAKIGLMYASDYFYASENKYWNSCGNDGTNHLCNVDPNISFRNMNWLMPKHFELTMSYGTGVFNIFGGYIIYDEKTYVYTVRPSFYLLPTINLVGGNGTKANPYRIII